MKAANRNNSRVLVTLPTLGDRIDLLEKTLISITSQKNIKVDILLVFPGNQKKVYQLAKKYKTLIAEDPGTLSGALNVGINKLQPNHDYFGWLGDDDLLYEDSLSITSELLDSNPESVLAYGACDYIDSKSVKIYTNRSSRFAPWIINWGPNIIPLPGMLYRSNALKKAGYFDTKLSYAMDLDMLLRLKKQGKFIYTNKTLAAFRWHANSTTVANRQKSLKEAKIIKKRNLPKYLSYFSSLWEIPVALATTFATYRLNRL